MNVHELPFSAVPHGLPALLHVKNCQHWPVSWQVRGKHLYNIIVLQEIEAAGFNFHVPAPLEETSR